MWQKAFIFFILWIFAIVLSAQPGRTTLLSPDLRSLRLMVNDDPSLMPILELESTDRLEVSFDALGHDYRRFTYRLEHCDYEGRPTTDLFESDYLSSAAEEEVIEDYETSLNTTVQYTHYRFSLPNQRMRPLLSGNYRITISTEDEEGELQPVLRSYFAIVDRRVGIRANCTTDTDVDWNERHQQISLTLDCSNLTLRDAEAEVKTLVMQNRRMDNARLGVAPTAVTGNTLIWNHCRPFIFAAGNEFRKMEMLSTRYPGLHGESMGWFDPYYHYTLQQDMPRRNYLYDEDHDGIWIVRSEGSGDADVEADYVMTHFSLSMLPKVGRRVYVSGRWASTGLTDEYLMTYNEGTEAYEATIPLKLGHYNYQYLVVDEGKPGVGSTAETEGNFYQTENEYEILVYHRPVGARYWALVGYVTPIFRP